MAKVKVAVITRKTGVAINTSIPRLMIAEESAPRKYRMSPPPTRATLAIIPALSTNESNLF
jgi:hypothetical protein